MSCPRILASTSLSKVGPQPPETSSPEAKSSEAKREMVTKIAVVVLVAGVALNFYNDWSTLSCFSKWSAMWPKVRFMDAALQCGNSAIEITEKPDCRRLIEACNSGIPKLRRSFLSLTGLLFFSGMPRNQFNRAVDACAHSMRSLCASGGKNIIDASYYI